ncbi:MAG: hypothetical protein LLG40_13905 [Deltaproteobacteria bacterium]|nr:hypothetical protein [Deltaproteobacteria bacterium]
MKPKTQKRGWFMRKFMIELRRDGAPEGKIRRSLRPAGPGTWITSLTKDDKRKHIFVEYHGQLYILHSDRGDMSDPETRNDSYLDCMYIELTDNEKLIEGAV